MLTGEQVRAAIYARKSNEQNVSEDMKSVTRQVENAQKYIAEKGWTEGPTYMDDGISGAEFENRPGLQEMLRHTSEFDILVVSEQKSLGRESAETAYLVKRLDKADVQIYAYLDDEHFDLSTPHKKLNFSVQSYSDEDHRVKTAQRVHESLERKFLMGKPVGSSKFGYRIKKTFDSEGNIIDREWEIVPEEAAVVRRIFELYDSGWGHFLTSPIFYTKSLYDPYRIPMGFV